MKKILIFSALAVTLSCFNNAFADTNVVIYNNVNTDGLHHIPLYRTNSYNYYYPYYNYRRGYRRYHPTFWSGAGKYYNARNAYGNFGAGFNIRF